MENRKLPDPVDMITACMNQKLEAHDFSSLARRLRCLVSRTTLRCWVRDKVIFPVRELTDQKSKHLIFASQKLDALLVVLEGAYEERLGRLARSEREIRRHRAAATANALRILELNEKREREGIPILPEPNLAMSDNDARGVVSLTWQPKTQKIQSRKWGI
jgi:hypothetical protein